MRQVVCAPEGRPILPVKRAPPIALLLLGRDATFQEHVPFADECGPPSSIFLFAIHYSSSYVKGRVALLRSSPALFVPDHHSFIGEGRPVESRFSYLAIAQPHTLCIGLPKT